MTTRTANRFTQLAAACALAAASAATAHSAWILEIDTDGLDNGVVVYNPNFNFAADTNTASNSAAAAGFGTTGGDSIFGGDGTISADTYQYHYTPGADADNLVVPYAQSLGGAHRGTGLTGGTAGIYRLYALWPFTENVSGGPVTYTIVSDFDVYEVTLDQNGKGDEWVLIGDIDYRGGGITVFQTAGSNTFISMRASAIMFEQISRADTCDGDANGDGVVDVNDIAYVLFRLGLPCGL